MTMVEWSGGSYLLGVVSGLLAAFFSGFFGAAGKDAYTKLRRKLNPPEPEPVRVLSSFVPKGYASDSCLWANEVQIKDRQAEGYIVYLDPSDGAQRFIYPNPSSRPLDKAFLMLRPGAERLKDAD